MQSIEASSAVSSQHHHRPVSLFVPVEELVRQVDRQQRWLIFMRNCAICQGDHHEKPCGLLPEHCEFGQRLWAHMIETGCNDPRCCFPRCVDTRGLMRHFFKCADVRCPVCASVKGLIQRGSVKNGNAPQG